MLSDHSTPAPEGGTLRDLLLRHMGEYVSASFLLGPQWLVRQEGYLADVGADYLLLRQEGRPGCVGGDLYALKLVEFRDPPGKQARCPLPNRRRWGILLPSSLNKRSI